MQTIQAISSLKGETSRQDLHMKWKRGHFVKVVVKGGVQIRNSQGKFDTVTPKREPVCWINSNDIFNLNFSKLKKGKGLTYDYVRNKTKKSSIS